MNQYEWLDDYLSKKTGVTKDFKVEWGWNRYMVGGKMFAARCCPDIKYKDCGGREIITLKCDPLLLEVLIKEHEEIIPGFYMDKRNWISVFLDGALDEQLLHDLCDQSYKLVFNKLTKKLQNEIISA